MLQTVHIDGASHRLSPKQVIGQGGEAVVYDLGNGEVLKLYMEPNDPTYAGNPDAQQGARLRIQEHQTKLPSFPSGLPTHIVAPKRLARDSSSGGRIVGYTMPFLKDMEVLLSYSDRKWREQQGVDANQTVEVFQNLHQVVTAAHAAQLVLGDFNDLNVMVDAKGQPWIVDADSMQFGAFYCKTFTNRFVDPLRCKPDELVLASPHNINSDWYAFLTMLFQSLLFINPFFGGVHRPKTGKPLRNNSRVLHRVSVFNSEVIYPKAAIPLSALPDDLLGYFEQIFDHDKREVLPGSLLANLRWTTCSSCGISHARNVCPACAKPGEVVQTITVRGNVKATSLLRTTGRIIAVAFQGGQLRWLQHEHGAYRRETGDSVLQGALDPNVRVRIWGDKTVFGKGNTLATVNADGTRDRSETETIGRLALFDANGRHLYRIVNGRLIHDGKLGDVTVGSVLTNQTYVWSGERFGFGFYRAGALTRGFVFDAERPGINDSVPLPPIPGNLIDATCVFADHHAWFMLSTQDQGEIRNLCFVINDKGQLLASSSALQGDDSWLGGGIRGRMATGSHLYAATDAGIVRVATSNNNLVVDREFPNTEPFVSALSQLMPGTSGIHVVENQTITLLEIK